jgi:prepilin-type N-terminal cleavage/methylation domain-containing protein
MLTGNAGKQRAFTLIELLVVIAIIALLIAVLLPSLSKARQTAKISICQSNLHQIGVATQSYSTDYQDKLWSFTVTPATYDRLTYPDTRAWAQNGDDLAAAAAQAVDIIRRRGGRDGDPAAIIPALWIPHVLYNHLVLQDYLAARLPEKSVACPEDVHRLRWQQDPRAFGNAGALAYAPIPMRPGQNATEPLGWRWPYSSSYETVTYHYSPERMAGGRLRQGPYHYNYYAPAQTNVLGKRKLSEVQFPSQKVQMMDSASRHFGKRWWWYSHASARIPLLFYDVAVKTKLTGPVQSPGQPAQDANEGWDPAAPANPFATVYAYTPERWEPPALNGGYMDQGSQDAAVYGFYRWTRAGLVGVDFEGREVQTTTGW